jgi:hypothetical protein
LLPPPFAVFCLGARLKTRATGCAVALACINNSFKLKNNKNSTIFQKNVKNSHSCSSNGRHSNVDDNEKLVNYLEKS